MIAVVVVVLVVVCFGLVGPEVSIRDMCKVMQWWELTVTVVGGGGSGR